MKYIILIAGILSNVFANVLVKVAMMPPRKIPTLKDPLSVLTNWPLWLGLCMYGLAFVIYAAVLTKLPLHVANPILTSGSIAGVTLLSAFMFKETLTITAIAGICLVIFGVILISISE